MPKKETIVGRKHEQLKLNKAYNSKRAEFIAVYGRRRVGKTYLVRDFFTNKPGVYFQVTGIHKSKQQFQLTEFTKEIARVFFSGKVRLETPKSWMDAFEILTECINKAEKKKKIILFFDELPWMAMRSSKLLQAIEYYWNRYWVSIPNLKFVVCGSATSWIINKIIKNKGGLHNRVTLRLPLEPFDLVETKEFLAYEGINYDQYQTLQLYMCIGGVPFYLTMLDSGLSAIQNINKICFQKKGGLLDEYENLFSSLFSNAEPYKSLIEVIASKREGVSREEIECMVRYKGGRLSKRLSELEEVGFIASFTPWGREKKGLYYKIIDEYTLFYLTWISPKTKNRIQKEITTKYWEKISQTQSWKSWAGLAFEAISFKHIGQIKRALHIPDGAAVYTWKYIPKKTSQYQTGAQIDLIFDREDGVINICELKYRKSEFSLDKGEANKILQKAKIYREITKTKKLVFLSLVTTFGLKESASVGSLITSFATMKDLFQSV